MIEMPYTALTAIQEKVLNKESPGIHKLSLGTWLKGLAAAVVTLTGAETLTNKILTSPKVTDPEMIHSFAAHDYGAAAEDWVLSAAEAKKRFLIATNANGAVNAVIPAASNFKEFVVVNTSGQALTIKAPSGTGIVVASTKTAIVYFAGTNVARLTPDA
jgi:hypothetical protein